MGAKGYPNPKPYVVRGFKDQAAWNRADRPIASREEFMAYCAESGREPGDYDAWQAQAWAVRDARDKAPSPVQASAAVKTDAGPPAPLAVPVLAWERDTRSEVNERPLNVDLPVATLDRLKTYAARHKVKLKVVVAGMLDAMLTMKGG